MDGLELNFYSVPQRTEAGYEDIEMKQIEILRNVKASVKIPVSVKLSSYHTNLVKHISDLDNAGVDAFVLFNRLFPARHRYSF